jgi:predicted AlkP superfamily phosphohydrolase/phosphomutase
MSRVIVLGLDGLPCSLLRRFIAEGVMPQLGALVARGDLTAMDTVYPPLSSVSWTTFFTGVNPGRHRIFGFFEAQVDEYGIWFQNLDDVKVPTLWDLAQAHGKRTVSINLPGTYPAPPFNGVMISGFIATDLAKSVYPKMLLPLVEKLGYLLDVPCERVAEEPEVFWKAVGQSLEARGRIMAALLENEPHDLFIGVFTETDRVQHFFFDAIEEPSHPEFARVRKFYAHVDAIVGRLAALARPEDELIILADHGFCRIEQELFLNRWLADHGYLVMKTPKMGAPLAEIDPEQSRAFALDPGRIFLNVRGRQPTGCVDPAEAGRLRDEIAAGLGALRVRVPWQAEPICPFEKIMCREEIYAGPWAHLAADLVLHTRDGFEMKGKFNHPALSQFGTLNGMHTFGDAMLYIRGRRWPANSTPRIIDLAPTILTLLGVPVPPELEGRALF